MNNLKKNDAKEAQNVFPVMVSSQSWGAGSKEQGPGRASQLGTPRGHSHGAGILRSVQLFGGKSREPDSWENSSLLGWIPLISGPKAEMSVAKGRISLPK